jgi:hypothetical protein
MKKIAVLFVFAIGCLVGQAQTLKKVAIANTGCSVYTYCDTKFEKQYSEDSSELFIGDCKNGIVTYGLICVKLRASTDDLDRAEELVINYLDYLKSTMNIEKAAGYGKGHRLKDNENTRGVLDYWEDKDKFNWEVKGWTDGNFICILYANSLGELPEQKVNVFLDSFRLPGH